MRSKQALTVRPPRLFVSPCGAGLAQWRCGRRAGRRAQVRKRREAGGGPLCGLGGPEGARAPAGPPGASSPHLRGRVRTDGSPSPCPAQAAERPRHRGGVVLSRPGLGAPRAGLAPPGGPFGCSRRPASAGPAFLLHLLPATPSRSPSSRGLCPEALPGSGFGKKALRGEEAVPCSRGWERGDDGAVVLNLPDAATL